MYNPISQIIKYEIWNVVYIDLSDNIFDSTKQEVILEINVMKNLIILEILIELKKEGR